MRDKLKKVWLRIHLWIAVLVALLGFAYFITQALTFADTLPPIAPEEGMNLYKGFLFASGRYQPFQDYGLWTNQMPLAYLIPGLVQARNGPGMEIGRTYAVVVGALAVIGLWLAARRSSNNWWAAGVVWVIALNPTYVQVFSQAKAESLVSMLFAWMMVFGLGAERQDRELALAAFLAGLAGMTSPNVLLVLPLFLIYVFWQFDRRAGWIALVAGLLPIVLVHALYWPEILKAWVHLFPPNLFSWAEQYLSPGAGSYLPQDFSWWPVQNWISDREHLAWDGIRALGQAVRVNFVVFFGLLMVLFLWPWRRKNRSSGRSITQVFFNQHKQVVFLLATFLVMFGVHLWAANGRNCLFGCLPGDIMYFFVFGLLLLPVASSGWREEISYFKQILAVLVIFLFLLALEYNFNADYINFRHDLIRYSFDLTVPSWEDGKLAEGTGKVWEVLENKYGFDHFPIRKFILYDHRMVVIIRWVKVLAFMIVLSPLAYGLSEKYELGPENYGSFMLIFTLLVGFVFSGSRASGGFLVMEPCQDSVVSSYELVGEQLNTVIPEEAQLYWGVKDNMLLLYLPTAEVYPPQLNASFTYLDDLNTDTDKLLKFGWWNSILKEQWVEEADLIVLENRYLDTEWQALLDAGSFEQILVSEQAASCRGDDSRIVVLKPVP